MQLPFGFIHGYEFHKPNFLLKVVKRATTEVPDHQEYLRRASMTGMPLQTNHQIRFGQLKELDFTQPNMC